MKKLLAIVLCLLMIGSVAVCEKIDIKSIFGVDEEEIGDIIDSFHSRSDLEVLAFYAVAYNELVDRYNNGNSDVVRVIPKMNEKFVDIFDNSKDVSEDSIDEDSDVKSCYDYGLGQLVPDPSILFGREIEKDRGVFANSNLIFMTYIRDCSEEEYFAYVDAIKAYGFDAEIFEESSYWYSARNEQGNKARIVYIYPDIYVEINK